jgi:hypothetical protein
MRSNRGYSRPYDMAWRRIIEADLTRPQHAQAQNILLSYLRRLVRRGEHRRRVSELVDYWRAPTSLTSLGDRCKLMAPRSSSKQSYGDTRGRANLAFGLAHSSPEARGRFREGRNRWWHELVALDSWRSDGSTKSGDFGVVSGGDTKPTKRGTGDARTKGDPLVRARV